MRVSTRVSPIWSLLIVATLSAAAARGQIPAPRRLPAVEDATPLIAHDSAIAPPAEQREPGPLERTFAATNPGDWCAGNWNPGNCNADNCNADNWETSVFLSPEQNEISPVLQLSAEESLPGADQTAGLITFDAADILRRLDRQEAELRALRQQVADRPVVAPDNIARPVAYGDNGKSSAEKKTDDGWVDLSTEKWTLKPGGHVQMDYPLWMQHAPPIPAENYFEFRRLRFMVDGTGYGVYDFRLQVDYEPEAGDNVATPVVDVKDAYLTAHEVPVLQRWRIGNFFVPFGLEQVTNDTNNIFLERSIPTQNIFCGDREVGFATYGHSEDMNTTWSFGAFFDRISESRKEKIDDRQGIRVSSRFTHLLYYDEPSNGRYLVHTGGGLFYTHFYDKLTRFRARPQIHEGPFLIDSGDIGAVDDLTGNVELATVWGPFSVQSELYMCHVNLAGGDQAKLYGYYVYASYFLTGESRVYERYGQHGAQFARNVPFSNFFLIPGCYGPGGWELKVRTSNLNLNQLNDGQYQDITAGVNWYWSDRIRVMIEWIHPWTTAQTVYGTTQSDILGMRMDFNW